MTFTNWLAYAGALAAAVATPGPATVAIVSAGITRPRGAAFRLSIGVALSDVVLLSVVLLGLTALAATFGAALNLIRYAGAAYLVWMGLRIWRTASAPLADATLPSSGNVRRDVLLGFGIGFGNPKAMLFHASLMPLIVDMTRLDVLTSLEIAATVLAVDLIVLGACAAIAQRSSAKFATANRRRLIARTGGAAMIGAATVIALRR
jgi:threonine/homoserine/homoserine lactone efflux protein